MTFAHYLNIPATSEETLSPYSQTCMSTLHEACHRSFIIICRHKKKKKIKRKEKPLKNQRIEGTFHLERGVKSDGGGERMDPGTQSVEMKTLVKKPANTIKAIRYTASSGAKLK